MHPFATVARGRIHHQYSPQTVFVEKEAMKSQGIETLKEQGYSVVLRPSHAKVFLVKRYLSGELVGVSDPRGQGQPIGPSLTRPAAKTSP